MKKAMFITFSVLILTACSVHLVSPIQEDADRGKKMFSSLTLEKLNKGKRLYEENCDLCHRKQKLDSESTEEWEEIVPRMVRKVNGKKGEKIFDAENEEILLQYILTMRNAPERTENKVDKG